MGKKCDCAQVCLDNQDKKFSELIREGLICKTCSSNYNEFYGELDNTEDSKEGPEKTKAE